MKMEKKMKPSLLRKVALSITCIGMIIECIGLIAVSFIKLNHQAITFLSISLILTVISGITAVYLIIKENEYWTNDPSVMSPLRKFGKKMFFIGVGLAVVGMVFRLELLFIIASLVCIISLIVWKIKFVTDHSRSSSSDTLTNPSYSSVSGNIYNR